MRLRSAIGGAVLLLLVGVAKAGTSAEEPGWWLDRAIEIIDGRPEDDQTMAALYTVCEAAVDVKDQTRSPELLNRAEAAALRQAEPYLRALYLCHFTRQWLATGDVVRARHAAQAAREACSLIENPLHQTTIRTEVATILALVGEHALAEEEAGSIHLLQPSAFSFRMIADALIVAGETDRARRNADRALAMLRRATPADMAAMFSDDFDDDIAQIAVLYGRLNDLAAAHDVIAQLGPEARSQHGHRAWIDIAAAQFEAGDESGAVSSLATARTLAARTQDDDLTRAFALRTVAEAELEHGDIENGRNTLSLMQPSIHRPSVQLALSKVLAARGEQDEAFRIAEEVRATTTEFAEASADMGYDLEGLERKIEAMRRETFRRSAIEARLWCARIQMARGDVSDARRRFGEVELLIEQEPASSGIVSLLVDVADAYASLELPVEVDRMLAAIRRTVDDVERDESQALAARAAAHAHAKHDRLRPLVAWIREADDGDLAVIMYLGGAEGRAARVKQSQAAIDAPTSHRSAPAQGSGANATRSYQLVFRHKFVPFMRQGTSQGVGRETHVVLEANLHVRDIDAPGEPTLVEMWLDPILCTWARDDARVVFDSTNADRCTVEPAIAAAMQKFVETPVLVRRAHDGTLLASLPFPEVMSGFEDSRQVGFWFAPLLSVEPITAVPGEARSDTVRFPLRDGSEIPIEISQRIRVAGRTATTIELSGSAENEDESGGTNALRVSGHVERDETGILRRLDTNAVMANRSRVGNIEIGGDFEWSLRLTRTDAAASLPTVSYGTMVNLRPNLEQGRVVSYRLRRRDSLVPVGRDGPDEAARRVVESERDFTIRIVEATPKGARAEVRVQRARASKRTGDAAPEEHQTDRLPDALVLELDTSGRIVDAQWQIAGRAGPEVAYDLEYRPCFGVRSEAGSALVGETWSATAPWDKDGEVFHDVSYTIKETTGGRALIEGQGVLRQIASVRSSQLRSSGVSQELIDWDPERGEVVKYVFVMESSLASSTRAIHSRSTIELERIDE